MLFTVFGVYVLIFPYAKEDKCVTSSLVIINQVTLFCLMFVCEVQRQKADLLRTDKQ